MLCKQQVANYTLICCVRDSVASKAYLFEIYVYRVRGQTTFSMNNKYWYKVAHMDPTSDDLGVGLQYEQGTLHAAVIICSKAAVCNSSHHTNRKHLAMRNCFACLQNEPVWVYINKIVVEMTASTQLPKSFCSFERSNLPHL